jgi:hypothetical protein
MQAEKFVFASTKMPDLVRAFGGEDVTHQSTRFSAFAPVYNKHRRVVVITGVPLLRDDE